MNSEPVDYCSLTFPISQLSAVRFLNINIAESLEYTISNAEDTGLRLFVRIQLNMATQR